MYVELAGAQGLCGSGGGDLDQAVGIFWTNKVALLGLQWAS